MGWGVSGGEEQGGGMAKRRFELGLWVGLILLVDFVCGTVALAKFDVRQHISSTTR